MDPDELDPNDALPPEDDEPELSAAPDDDDDALPADAGEDAEPDADAPAQRRPSRGARDYGALRSENRELRTRLEALERGARQPTGPSAADRERAEREERERLQYMSPEERADYLYEKGRREMQAGLGTLQAQLFDQTDAARFDVLCGRNKLAERYRDQVEEAVRRELANGGRGIKREAVLALIVGQNALKGHRAPAAQRQRREGAASVARERVRPPANARTGAAPADRSSRLSEREARRQRLEGVTF